MRVNVGARAFSQGLWGSLEGDPREVVEQAVREQYAELFGVMPQSAYLTYGNVDVPRLWPDYVQAGHTVLDGEVVEIGGRTWGFVGGGLRTPMRTPHEVDDDAYAEKVARTECVNVGHFRATGVPWSVSY